MSDKITHLFNRFAGREIPVTETVKSFEGRHIKAHAYTEARIADPQDPTLVEMKKVAEENGLRLRLWLPGSSGTKDFRTDRLNAYIEKGADDKYRVSNKFNIG